MGWRAIGVIGVNIRYLCDRASQYGTAGGRVLGSRHWHHAAHNVQSFVGQTKGADMIHDLAVKPHHEGKLSATQPDRAFCDRIEHWLNIGRRTRNDAEYFRRRRLLLQRLSELVEQSRVLNGDDRLSGEVLDEINLLVGEWANFLAIEENSADQFVFLEHWHAQHCPSAAEFDGCNVDRNALGIAV